MVRLLAFILLTAGTALSDDVARNEPSDLSWFLDGTGRRQPIGSLQDWGCRRTHILQNLQRVMGPLPPRAANAPVQVTTLESVPLGTLERRKIAFATATHERVPAYLILPTSSSKRGPAILCLHQTTGVGKDEPAGLRGDPELAYGLELAQRGFVVLIPDYPSLGEFHFDFQAHPQLSGSMIAIEQNRCAIDILQSLPQVDAERIAVIGHSLGGHNGLFTAVFEPRVKVIVCSCGFSALSRDDLPSWTGPRYLPRIATEFGNDRARVPFDFHEILASLAPRPVFVCAPEHDADFDVEGVREVMTATAGIYRRYEAEDRLKAVYPPVRHSFPRATRDEAYRFLDLHLRGP